MGPKKNKIRILIVDDHALLRAGLRSLLEEVYDFSVVGETDDGHEAQRLVNTLEPDVLLLDLAMPKFHGIEVLRRLGSKTKELRIIVLAAEIDKDQTDEVFRLGARGLILKESASSLLAQCILSVMEGKYWFLRKPTSDLSQLAKVAAEAQGSDARSRNFGLTGREMEILAAIVAGRSNRELAEQFSISQQTVKHHLTNIFDKVGVYNRLELALFAIHHRLIQKP